MAKQTFDFSESKDRSEINPVHQPPGDYRGKIIKCTEGDSKSGKPMITYIIQDTDRASATYAYYCPTEKIDQLWKFRNLLIASGLQVPQKKIAVDPQRIVGKSIGMTLETEEYNGKEKSSITSVFPESDLANEDEPIVKKKPTSVKKVVEEEEDEDLEELDIDDL